MRRHRSGSVLIVRRAPLSSCCVPEGGSDWSYVTVEGSGWPNRYSIGRRSGGCGAFSYLSEVLGARRGEVRRGGARQKAVGGLLIRRHRSHFGSRYTTGPCNLQAFGFFSGLLSGRAWCAPIVAILAQGTLGQALRWRHALDRPWTGLAGQAGLWQALGALFVGGRCASMPMTTRRRKADSTLRSSRAVPHPSTNRALCRLTSEVERDPVHSTRYGRQRQCC